MFKQWLKDNYNFTGEIEVELLRSYTNDVYLVKDSQKKYILKIYSPSWRTEDEILWEIDLVKYLVSSDIPVASVLSSKNGASLEKISQEKTDLWAVLFEYAAGEKPKPPFTPELQYQVGKAAAKLHKASDGFHSLHQRPEINLKYLIDDSLEIAQSAIQKPADLKLYQDLAHFLKTKISEFSKQGLDWGPIHGDLTLDNIHITSDHKITFYDFDSAGFGWRSMELYGWVALRPDKKANAEAYLRGYQEIRPIKPINIEAAPYLQAASDMWLKKGMMALRSPEVLNQQLDQVKAWAKYFEKNLAL